MDRLKQYWGYLGENHLKDCQLNFFSNGFFQVFDHHWQTVNIYDNFSNIFINRLSIAHSPSLTFHVFKNGYMATTDQYGGIDIYSPDGRFFTRLKRQVKWWGTLDAYVYIDDNQYYLADITDAKKTIPLGTTSSILFVEQNVNGLISIRRYTNQKENYADLYNANMEQITPVQDADKIIFFTNGSFIIRANKNFYLYNAQMELLLDACFEMKIFDEHFCLMRSSLYDTTTGSAISADNKPIYTSNGKLFIIDETLLSEDGKQILGYCPVRPHVFDGHWLHLRFNGRDLIFDSRLSLTETRQTVLRTMFERNEEDDDISQNLFNYLCLIEICASGKRDIRRSMLKGFLSD